MSENVNSYIRVIFDAGDFRDHIIARRKTIQKSVNITIPTLPPPGERNTRRHKRRRVKARSWHTCLSIHFEDEYSSYMQVNTQNS